ncbi:MAG: hypothetical protein HKO65_16285 [Gemmatimonadetes bacterium]|nr:hypothetical protein [Gemmatimonadota bacterium]
MSRPRLAPFLLAVCLVLSVAVAGCASGGSGGRTTLRRDIGNVMIPPLTTAREKVFGKYQIPMYREEGTSRSIMWETDWLPRQPAPEETAAGVTGGRNRITIRGTYVEERMDGTPVLRVRLEVENQIRTALNPEWHPGPMPEAVEDRFEEIYDDLMLEVRAGIIR